MSTMRADHDEVGWPVGRFLIDDVANAFRARLSRSQCGLGGKPCIANGAAQFVNTDSPDLRSVSRNSGIGYGASANIYACVSSTT